MKYGDELARKLALSLHDAVATLADIDVIAPEDRTDSMLVACSDAADPSTWIYLASSSTAAGTDVRVPNNDPALGRWHRTNNQAYHQTVATMAVLGGLAGYPDGALVATSTPNALWRLNMFFRGDVTVDPRRTVAAYIAPPGTPGAGGAWVREISLGEPGANDCQEQFIFPSNPIGSDDNHSKQDDFSLVSLTEAIYRLGEQPIDGATVGLVTWQLAPDTIAGPLTIDVKFKNDGALAVVGTRTVISTHTITAVTPWNTATGVLGQYTLSGAPDLSTMVGKFVRITTGNIIGPRDGWKAPIAKAISPGVFRATWGNPADGSAVEPVVGDTVQLYSVTKIHGDVRINGGPVGTNGGTVYFQDCEIGTPGSDHSVVVSGGQATFIACRLYGLDFYEGVALGTVNLCHVTECRSYGFVVVSASTFATMGGTPLSARGGGLIHVSTRCLIQGGGISAGHTLEGPGDVRATAPFAAVDYIGSAAQVFPGSSLVLDDVMTARDAASAPQAVLVNSGGQLFYATGKAPVIVGTAPTTSDYKIGGTTKAKAAIPYFETANGAVVAVSQ